MRIKVILGSLYSVGAASIIATLQPTIETSNEALLLAHST
jgi:hypothetical protein